jgi:hypothetical protein
VPHGAWPIVLVSPRTQTPHNGTAARHGVTQATMTHAPCTMVSYGAATGARPIALVSQRTQPPPNGNATHEATTAITRPTTRTAATSRLARHTRTMPPKRAWDVLIHALEHGPHTGVSNNGLSTPEGVPPDTRANWRTRMSRVACDGAGV